jgi:methylated-DNA-protein-cysteine methyltransferase related protein
MCPQFGYNVAVRVHPDVEDKGERPALRVYAWVRRIPRGRVMTYGQISALLRHRISARAVGWAMHASPKGVPWHRVVNASGGCSTDRLFDFPAGFQRHLLEKEGVVFSKAGNLDLKRYRWTPRTG